MGVGKRLLDLARANLNALLDKAAGDARVEELTDDELEAELLRRRDRRRREEAARLAAGAAERAARARAAARAAQRPDGKGPEPRRPPPPRARAPVADARVARLYATLETPVGADFETVRSNFRRLMRKYHPDVNAGTPETLKAATERSALLNAAYNELELLLTRR